MTQDTKPTLSDLYDGLDWSQADTMSTEQDGSESLSDWRKRFRCAIIESALWDDDVARANIARQKLAAMGVWDQAIKFLEKRGLMGESKGEFVLQSSNVLDSQD